MHGFRRSLSHALTHAHTETGTSTYVRTYPRECSFTLTCKQVYCKMTSSGDELQCTFIRTVLSHSCVPDSHTLLPPHVRDIRGELKQDYHSKSELSSRLLHNDPNVSEKLAEFCSKHGISKTTKSSRDPTNSHYYFLAISPSVNYMDKRKTQISTSGKIYAFDGFILVSQQQLSQVPPFCFQQYGYKYSLKLEPVNAASYSIMDALLMEEYLFNEVLQLFNFTHVLKCLNGTILFVPRFRSSDMTVLPLSCVLQWLMDTQRPLLEYIETELKKRSRNDLNQIADGWIITNPNSSPSSIRVDRLEWPSSSDKGSPHVVHFSCVFSNKSADQEVIRAFSKEVMLKIPIEGLLVIGIYTDLVQHALLLPQLLNHILYHDLLPELEEMLNYHFQDRQLLERALTSPSYSPLTTALGAQVKLTASNCGLRRPQIREDWAGGSGRGVKAEVRFAESQSEGDRLRHNEQLEFLGDATLEYLCSLHLYHILPNAKLGQLASYRTVLIKNKHLAVLAQKLKMDKFLLKGVGDSSEYPSTKTEEPLSPPNDPCSSSSCSISTTSGAATAMDSASHTVANTLEAVVGAVYLDGGLKAAQQLTARLFFPEDDLYSVWMEYPPDPLQVEYPEGDRHLIVHSPMLQRLVRLEESTGVQFRHIRLLAKAFTHSSMQHSCLVGGSYEKLEHLGDAVLQFLTSDYAYRKFPTLHEGRLSLLRTTLVQNKQLAELCKQLGFDQYIRTESTDVGVKILADVVESYLAALLLDKGLEYCQRFLEVCLFPKLLGIVEKSPVEDANTQLQKAIARLCRLHNLEHETPYYRQLGVSQNAPFTVGVYFKSQRLGTGVGDSLRDARKQAAEAALKSGVLKQIWWATSENF